MAAKAAAEAPDFALARMTHGLALAKRHIFWSEGASLLETAEAEVEVALKLQPKLAKAHLTRAIVAMAGGNTQQATEALETALNDGNLGAFRREVHSLKGASAAAGAERVEEVATRLEQLGSAGELEPAFPEFARLASEFDEVRNYFRSYLESRRRC